MKLGTRKAHHTGYVYSFTNGREKSVHVIIAERALGKPLPEQAVVHHANENKSDNRNRNLVICENELYHKLLHIRLEAFSTTGDPHQRRCHVCKRYDMLENLSVINKLRPSGKRYLSYYHRRCVSDAGYTRRGVSRTREYKERPSRWL